MTFWNIKAKAEQDTTEMTVYGDIGEWSDVDSREFTRALRQVSSKNITLRINSGGGSVFTAQAILSSLRRHPANVTVYIDGLAASAASVIAMAGDKIIMPSNSMMMIHNPWTGTYGEAKDMRKMADTLDSVRDSIVAAYKEKTTLDVEKIVQLMDDETWMTAAEAVELGFADEIEVTQRVAASANHGNMLVNGLSIEASRYKKLSQIIDTLPSAQESTTPTGAVAGKTEAKKETKSMTLDQLKAEHPDLHKQLLDEGAQAGVNQERARIKAIEEMAMKGHEQLITQAKFDTGISAESLAVQIVKAEKEKSARFLNDRQADANEIAPEAAQSDANQGLQTADDAKAAADKAELDAIVNAAVEGFNSRRKNTK